MCHLPLIITLSEICVVFVCNFSKCWIISTKFFLCGIQFISISFFSSFLSFVSLFFSSLLFYVFVYSFPWLTEGVFGKQNHLSLFGINFLVAPTSSLIAILVLLHPSPLFSLPCLLLCRLPMRADDKPMLWSDLGFNIRIIRMYNLLVHLCVLHSIQPIEGALKPKSNFTCLVVYKFFTPEAQVSFPGCFQVWLLNSQAWW